MKMDNFRATLISIIWQPYGLLTTVKPLALRGRYNCFIYLIIRDTIMDELFFERTMQLYFGDKAYQIAGSANNIKERKKWYYMASKEMMKHVNNLDVATKHKERLMASLNDVQSQIKKDKGPAWQTTTGRPKL